MQFHITTRYRTHPNSNSGRVEAVLRAAPPHRGRVGVRSVRIDQALSSEQNHRRAAEKMAAAFDLQLPAGGGWATDEGYTFLALG